MGRRYKGVKEKKGIKRRAKGLKNRTWFTLNIILTCIYLIWRFFFTIPVEYGVVSTVAGVSLFVVEFLGMLEALVHYFNMHDVQVKPLPEIPAGSYPEVDVFIATYNEPCDLLLKTVNGCKYMKYPEPGKVHIFLCDDGQRAEVRALAEKMGVGYLDREDHAHAKAGNLNHAMSVTDAPYILTLDADMIPHQNLLLHTIPFFVAQELQNEGLEEKDQKHIGFVQTPQSFYNPDLFQYNLYSEGRIPNEQDYFYRDIQVSRNKSNSVIYGGSNTVLSRRALNDIGGFYTGTITEDYATGILMQKKGYLCYATDEVLASGLSPTDLKSLVNQRIRWARGVISTNRKMHVFLSKELSMSQKVNYWASEWYWYAPLKRLIYFMSPILYATFGYMVIKCTLWQILLFWLPMYITSNVSLKMLSRNIRTTKWTSIYETVLFPFLLIPVLLETFGVTMKQFKVTQKGNVEDETGKNLIYLIPFALLVILSAIGIFNCFHMIFESNNMGPVVVLFWLLVNLFTLVMAMFFVMGRKPMRKSERAIVVMDCELTTEKMEYSCRTINISEHGLALELGQPINVDDEREACLCLHDGRYKAEVRAKVVHVNSFRGKWKYAFQITDYGDSYEEYLQLVYDRVPTLPQNLDQTSGGFDDLRININRRAAKPFYENRRLPRVFLKARLQDRSGRSWTMQDFNYKYCVLQNAGESPRELCLCVDEEKEVYIRCEKATDQAAGKLLYRVTNYDENYLDEEKKKILEAWVKREWQKTLQDRDSRKTEQEAAKPENETENQNTDFDEMEHI